MKRILFTKLTVLAILTFFAMNLSAIAGDKYQAKIKTSVSNAGGRNKIEIIVNFLKGVEDATFDDKGKGMITVEYDAEKTNADMIIHIIELMGYDAELDGEPLALSGKKPNDVERDNKSR